MSDPIKPNTETQNQPADDPGADLIASILNEQNQPTASNAEPSKTILPIGSAQPPVSDGTPVPMAVLVKKTDVTPPPKSPKKSRGVSVLIAGILVLLLSLPLVVSFMNQKKQTTDVRSKAAGNTNPNYSISPNPQAIENCMNDCRKRGDSPSECRVECGTVPTLIIPSPTTSASCMNDCFKTGHDGGYCTSLCSTISIFPSPSISSGQCATLCQGDPRCVRACNNPTTPIITIEKQYSDCLLLYGKAICDNLFKATPPPPTPGKIIAWQPCLPVGAVQNAECLDGQTSTRYICQGDKGWQPDLTATCTIPVCSWPRANKTDACCPPKTGVDSCTPGDHGGTDLYKCIPDPFISKCTWIEGCGGGYWKAEGWTDSTTSNDWKDFEKKCGITITPPPKITPPVTIPPGWTGTPPPGGTGTPPPGTGTLPPGGQCTRIKVYKDTVAVDPATLKAGDAVVLAVAGTNASKGRIRVNGGSWNESSTLNAQNEYTVAFTIPAGTTNFSIEAEVLVNGAWK
ncbi:hypothetical protein HY947_05250 [Candidatus Gottesmanbacteria bacterium]|nr:hypothetical protein [Candidatus Gottesmanbacteria bacterium]